ncbi:MAG: hypothetical protein VX000_03295, partial [Myxococcota bacterium]|nr:hypothetical protein [Myxococcota bacterium]
PDPMWKTRRRTAGTLLGMRPASAPALLALAIGCGGTEATPLPTAAAVAELDRQTQPPLYQLLYDSPALPAVTPEQQRVRILIWLRHMRLTDDQLARLDALRRTAAERAARLTAAERDIIAASRAEENDVYESIWTSLSSGAGVDAPEMGDATERLKQLRAGGQRERELLALRMEGLRSILDAENGFLRTLTPRQEALFADSLFFLRHRLDPVGTPSDFRVMVGSVYDPGQFDVLTRGSSDAARQRLNIGGLWSDDPQIEGHALHEARREVLLFLALQEPGLDQAIAVARSLAQTEPARAADAQAPGGPDSMGARAPAMPSPAPSEPTASSAGDPTPPAGPENPR